MSEDTSAGFLKALATQLAANGAFVGLVAQHVAKSLTSAGGSVRAATAAPAAAAPKRRGRPPKNAAPAAPAAKAAKSAGPKGGSSNVDRVLDAIRNGAGTKQEIRNKAKVTDAGYSYALKTLREQGRVRIVGTRRAAKILAV